MLVGQLPGRLRSYGGWFTSLLCVILLTSHASLLSLGGRPWGCIYVCDSQPRSVHNFKCVWQPQDDNPGYTRYHRVSACSSSQELD